MIEANDPPGDLIGHLLVADMRRLIATLDHLHPSSMIPRLKDSRLASLDPVISAAACHTGSPPSLSDDALSPEARLQMATYITYIRRLTRLQVRIVAYQDAS